MGEDPTAHIGQLLNALQNNVRFLCTVGLHTQKMSVSEAEAMFRNFAYQEFASARQQAVLGTYKPTIINATLGKLLLVRLRHDWQKVNGDSRDKLKLFHDALLSQGSPPIFLLRQRLLGAG